MWLMLPERRTRILLRASSNPLCLCFFLFFGHIFTPLTLHLSFYTRSTALKNANVFFPRANKAIEIPANIIKREKTHSRIGLYSLLFLRYKANYWILYGKQGTDCSCVGIEMPWWWGWASSSGGERDRTAQERNERRRAIGARRPSPRATRHSTATSSNIVGFPPTQQRRLFLFLCRASQQQSFPNIYLLFFFPIFSFQQCSGIQQQITTRFNRFCKNSSHKKR